MQETVTVKDIAVSLGRTERAIQVRAQKEAWPAVTGKVLGGRQRRYAFEMLPIDIRKEMAFADAERLGLVPREKAMAPAVLPSAPLILPDRAKDIGLAKYRLVKAWRDALKAAPWGKKGEAAAAFILAYNTGKLIPGVYNQVGEITEKTLRGLDAKLKRNKDDFLCLCDGRGGWKKHGTTKWRQRALSDAAQEALLKCYLHQSRPSVCLAIRAAKYALAKFGFEENSSDTTFRRWLCDWKETNMHIVTFYREGQKAYEDKYGPYLTRDWDQLEVGDLLVADGKVTNFHILNPYTGKPARMTWVNWMDCRSRDIVGWQIMPTENAIAILAAFHMAVMTLGKTPKHILIDNGKAFKSKIFLNKDPDFEEMAGLYSRLGVCAHFSRPYKGRSKINERFHRTMQEQAERLFPSYIGSSIEDKPAHMARNEAFHKKWHEAETGGWVPNIHEAGLMIQAYLGFYRREPHSGLGGETPMGIMDANRGPGVDVSALNREFLWREVCTPKRCRITIWKIDYESDCLHGVKHKVIAMFSTADMGLVHVYTPDGQYMGDCLPVESVHPLAVDFGDPVSADLVKHGMKRQRRLEREIKQIGLNIGATSEDLLGMLPYKPVKQPVVRTQPERLEAPEPPHLPEAEVKRLETMAEQAAAEGAAELSPDRPGDFTGDLDHYEWCFYSLYRDGYGLSDDDTQFMHDYEGSREFIENHQERFDGLKTIYAPQDQAAHGS